MAGTDKKPDDIDRRSEEIIEETMHEIAENMYKKDEKMETDTDTDHSDSVSFDESNSKADIGDKNLGDADQVEFYLEEDDFDEDLDEYENVKEEDDEYYEEDEDMEEDDIEVSEEEWKYSEDSDDEMEETEAQKELRKHNRRKKAFIIGGSFLGVLLLVYLGFAWYFSSHFLINTKINGTDFSLKSVEQVETYKKKQVENYELTLKEANNGIEVIKGSDILLEYVPGEALDKLVKKQNNLLWITSLFKAPQIKAEIGVKYDENALTRAIGNLQIMVPENQSASVNAQPQFQDTGFVVVPEVYGTQIDVEKFSNNVKAAINGFLPELDMKKAKCYLEPRFLSDSPEVNAAKDAMNKYLGASITYDFNPNTEVINAAVISQWVKVDQDMNVTFDAGAVQAFVQSLADKYNTLGKTRSFVSGSGKTVSVTASNYGWQIDQEAEYNALIANIQNAETVTREPHYASRAVSHGDRDFGDTYAEVDLTNQQIYFIQNGQVVLQSACVTGNPNKGYATPPGLFSLAYKATDQILRGQRMPDGTLEYETPVKYWMPFNGGIGFHDATWQPSFGGSRYQTVGSHGCVNLPYDVAGSLYSLISAGTPVICYF